MILLTVYYIKQAVTMHNLKQNTDTVLSYHLLSEFYKKPHTNHDKWLLYYYTSIR